MAALPCSSLILLSVTSLLSSLLLLLPAVHSQSAPAPAPKPSGPINITGILDKAGQYTVFIRLLDETQTATHIDNQVNNSRDGMTVFAPTNNAFNNLPSGTLNNLTKQQKVQLVQYHICPKYYSLDSLKTVSNPVRTQASGQDGRVFGLNFTAQGNQITVSSGIVQVPIYNAVRKDSPLAVYQVDKVLLPEEFYEVKSPAASPPPSANDSRSGSTGSAPNGGDATAPSTGNPGNDSRKISVNLGLVQSAILLLCMGLLS